MHVQNIRDYPQTKLDSEINSPFYRSQPKAGTAQFVPFVFSKSHFQGPVFCCDKIVVIVTLLEAIESIADKDYSFLGE